METKIEYQLTPELEEKLAVEQAMMEIPEILQGRWKFPILGAILLAVIFNSGEYKCHIHNVDYSTIFRIIAAAIGFCFGWGCGVVAQKCLLGWLLKRAKQNSRFLNQKLGVSRTVSWDAEWLMISHDAWKTQIKWQILDKIKNENIGIYFFLDGQIIFWDSKNRFTFKCSRR